MSSKERKLLERIANNNEMSFGPKGNTLEELKAFQPEAEDLMETLDWLVTEDFISGYISHPISYEGEEFIDRVLITGGLTFKGQDKNEWPD